MDLRCPKCGSEMIIQGVWTIDENKNRILVVCPNCGFYYDLVIETSAQEIEEATYEEEKIEIEVPRLTEENVPPDAPETVELFIKGTKPFIPFYIKKVMDQKPAHGHNVSVDFFRNIGINETTSKALMELMQKRGITKFYSFQEKAFEAILSDKNVLITAPTGTGKTEAFAIPAFIKAQVFSRGNLQPPHVLIVYPTKALARDQLDKLKEYASIFNLNVGVLDGDTSRYERQKILRSPPDILITNFDMINYHLSKRTSLGFLFTRTKLLIMDEAHQYSGAFGTHIYFILKRLRRLVKKEGFNLQVIMSSATITNPEEFASIFLEENIEIVQETGRKTPLYILFVFPTDAIHRTMASIVNIAIENGNKILAFLNSRKNAELTLFTLKRLSRKLRHLRNKFDIHRAGISKEIRRRVENDFKSGKKLALVTTPTLELGIDIGDIDIVASEIAPVDNFIQRSGRAGRRDRPGIAILLLRQDDPISQYYLKKPEEYLKDRSLKYIEPNNQYIAEKHLYLAAYEMPIPPHELDEFGTNPDVVQTLIKRGSLVSINERLYANKAHFQKYFTSNIRGSDALVRVQFGNEIIDEREAIIAIRELHPEAIYLNRGRKYLVEKLDLEKRIAYVMEVDSSYDPLYTKPRYSYSAVPVKIIEEKDIFGTKLYFGIFKMTALVDGYFLFREGYKKPIKEVDLEEPVKYKFDTYALAFRAPDIDLVSLEEAAGTYHATEHILIEGTNSITGGGSEDLGGISFGTTGIIVIYDGTPGGNGVSKLLFNRFNKAVSRSYDILTLCKKPNLEEFNKCVYSYRCGNNNRPLFAPGALKVLELMLKEEEVPYADQTLEELRILDRGYV
ncbi:MAG: DEAD/DEAH box helicase [Candidatus Njordarchaeia archaeon]